MKTIQEFLKVKNIFNSSNKKNKKRFKETILQLTNYHTKKCDNYKKVIQILKKGNKIPKKLSDFPFLPSRIFKDRELKSIKDSEIFKTLTSSGTSSSQKSKIFLDKENSKNQIKALTRILSSHFGQKRLPMLVVDKDPSLNSRSQFSASTAAIYGFSIFASKQYFLINNNNKVDNSLLNKFMKKYSKESFFIFGFTSQIYEYLLLKSFNKKFNFSKGILIHGGGWKKLEKLKISNKNFKSQLGSRLGIKKVHNYYGLVEQTGSIFFECKNGYFVSSIFSDVIIRDKNFEILPSGKKGFIQLLSILPTSYPGHSLITEDIGEIYKGNCNCELKGKHFLVHGRAKEAEIRGCSDTK